MAGVKCSGVASARLLLGLHLVEERFERFEAGLPVPTELFGPERRVFQRRGAAAAKMLPPAVLDGEKAPDDALGRELGATELL